MSNLWLVVPALGCPLMIAATLALLLRRTPARGHRQGYADLRRDAAAFRARLSTADPVTGIALDPALGHGACAGTTLGTAR